MISWIPGNNLGILKWVSKCSSFKWYKSSVLFSLPITLQKYSAIIIGAGDATGSALCKKFALNGYKVCAARRPGNLDKFKQLENDIKAADGWIKCFGVDAREEESIQDLFKQVEEEIAPIDVVIFNPGAENEEFVKLLEEHKIEPVIACTLVMISINEY